jgi:hypothetical protein
LNRGDGVAFESTAGTNVSSSVDGAEHKDKVNVLVRGCCSFWALKDCGSNEGTLDETEESCEGGQPPKMRDWTDEPEARSRSSTVALSFDFEQVSPYQYER